MAVFPISSDYMIRGCHKGLSGFTQTLQNLGDFICWRKWGCNEKQGRQDCLKCELPLCLALKHGLKFHIIFFSQFYPYSMLKVLIIIKKSSEFVFFLKPSPIIFDLLLNESQWSLFMIRLFLAKTCLFRGHRVCRAGR